MATHDNREWRRRQNDASTREFTKARNEIAILESILSLPRSCVPNGRVFSRLENLKAQAAQLVDPNDNGEQREPIILRRTR